MRTILAIVALTASAFGQSYPSSIFTPLVAKDNVATTLSSAMSAVDTVAVVTSSTGWSANMLAYICDSSSSKTTCTGTFEVMLVTSVTGNVITVSRTTPIAHNKGVAFSNASVSRYNTSLTGEVLAIETALGPNLSNIPTSTTKTSTTYIFAAQHPAGALIAGTTTITMTPVPIGVNGTDVGHYLYVSTTGTPEACLINGGSGTSGQTSGSISILCAGAHSVGWSIQSATAGIQEAISTGNGGPVFVTIPQGTYSIYGPINVPLAAVITGQGNWATALSIDTSFSTSVNGVFIFATGSGAGPTVSNLNVSFVQPDSVSLGVYTHWPPAFYAVSAARFTIENVSVYRAWDVVNMTGNSGGSFIHNLQASHFHTGILIDGSLDSVYLNEVRFWPYALSGNQQTLFFNPANGAVGLSTARCDDINIRSFFSENPIGIHFWNSGGGNTSGNANGVTLDTVSEMLFDDGNVNMSNFSSSVGTFNISGIVVNGGLLRISDGLFFPGVGIGTSQPFIKQTAGVFQLANSWFWTAANDVASIEQTGGSSTITGNYFNRFPNVAYSIPTIYAHGSLRITAIGNKSTDKGAGGGTFISVGTDDFNQIRANIFVGWAASYPATITAGYYESDSFTIMRGIVNSTTNLVSAETGANNAIAGSLIGANFNSGQIVYVILAHTLQAGANTFNLNGVGAVAIKKHTAPTVDISTAYASGAVIQLFAQGGVWQDMSQ